jgi:hypothetical protein
LVLREHYVTGPDQLSRLFSSDSSTSTTTELSELKILAGCYNDEQEIPYSGGVLDSFQFTNDSFQESVYFN